MFSLTLLHSWQDTVCNDIWNFQDPKGLEVYSSWFTVVQSKDAFDYRLKLEVLSFRFKIPRVKTTQEDIFLICLIISYPYDGATATFQLLWGNMSVCGPLGGTDTFEWTPCV